MFVVSLLNHEPSFHRLRDCEEIPNSAYYGHLGLACGYLGCSLLAECHLLGIGQWNLVGFAT